MESAIHTVTEESADVENKLECFYSACIPRGGTIARRGVVLSFPAIVWLVFVCLMPMQRPFTSLSLSLSMRRNQA